MDNQKVENQPSKKSGGKGMGGGRGKIVEKPKNFKKSIGRVVKYSKSEIWWIVLALVFVAAATVLMLMGPDRMRQITTILSDAIRHLGATGEWIAYNMQSIINIAITLVTFYAISAVLNYSQGFIMATITQRISKNLRKDISKKINKLPLKYIDSTTYGNILSRVTNDVDTIGQTLNNSVTSFVSAIVMMIGCLIMMFVTNWIMALSAIAASLIGFFVMAIIMAKSQKYFIAQQRDLGEINGLVEEVYSGHEVIKVYNATKQTKAEYDKINEKLYHSAWKSQFLSSLMMPIMSFVGNFSYVVVCVVGAVLTMNGTIDFGVIVAFMLYIRYFTNQLSSIAQAFTSFQSTAAAAERVFEFLDEEELLDESKSVVVTQAEYNNLLKEKDKKLAQLIKQKENIEKQMQDAVSDNELFIKLSQTSEQINKDIEKTENEYKDYKIILDKVKGNVEFKNVKFGYNKDKVIIKDFSANVKAGQKVAIVGPTGAGKTTMVNLLMRFYEVNKGDILIDGVSISDLTRENVHDLFSMVLQDTWMFEGTVEQNIIYSKKGVLHEQVVEACVACGVDHFIKTLPNGYNTVLDDNTSISAGQKQLLTIARAMVQNSPMLILDEATSSVDTRTEELIQKAMDKLMKGRTSFVIAHRLSTIKNADLILVMKEGDVIEKGNHKELIAAQGFYADLYNSQFSEKQEEDRQSLKELKMSQSTTT